MIADTVTIDNRFNGPPESGNGGYVCGLIGRHFAGPAEVTLKAPPPLNTDLDLYLETGSRALSLFHGEDIIAKGKAASLDLELPEAPSFQTAADAARGFRHFENHAFPTCFVCGPARNEGDGLRIFAGPLDQNRVAAPWTPDASLADVDGLVSREFLWAAIDCPGYEALGADLPCVLGRMTADIYGDIHPGESCVVLGWPLGVEGRKHFAATALYNAQGRCIAASRQIWKSLM